MPGELGLAHQGMRAEGDKVVAGSGPRADFFLQKLEHQRHRHGASAVGNDDEHTLAGEVQAGGGLGNDLADFIRERSLSAAFLLMITF